MKAGNLGAGDAAHQRLLDNLGSALCAGALPGELKDFGEEDCRAAARRCRAAALRLIAAGRPSKVDPHERSPFFPPGRGADRIFH